jgi:hypothetical protein
MTFDLASDPPRVQVRTWSSHYRTLSTDLETYADWYRPAEHPEMTDTEFVASDDFELVLDDFRDRFGPPAK